MTEHKKNYNEGRKAHSMPLEISKQLESIKDTKKFKSIGETVQYLLDLENDLQKNAMIIDRYKCKKCDKDVNVTNEMTLDLHKFRHRNCKSEDPKDKDCDGVLRHAYGLTRYIGGTNENNDDKELVILRRGLKDDEIYRTIDVDQGKVAFLSKEENEIFNKTGKLPDLSNENNEG